MILLVALEYSECADWMVLGNTGLEMDKPDMFLTPRHVLKQEVDLSWASRSSEPCQSHKAGLRVTMSGTVLSPTTGY